MHSKKAADEIYQGVRSSTEPPGQPQAPDNHFPARTRPLRPLKNARLSSRKKSESGMLSLVFRTGGLYSGRGIHVR